MKLEGQQCKFQITQQSQCDKSVPLFSHYQVADHSRWCLQVEASQSMIRIVGLSATLPNYADVANFLGVNTDTGLFYFDASYRPVPLEMQFIGVNEKNPLGARNIQDDVCYEKVSIQQLMRWLHSVNGKTGLKGSDKNYAALHLWSACMWPRLSACMMRCLSQFWSLSRLIHSSYQI